MATIVYAILPNGKISSDCDMLHLSYFCIFSLLIVVDIPDFVSAEDDKNELGEELNMHSYLYLYFQRGVNQPI